MAKKTKIKKQSKNKNDKKSKKLSKEEIKALKKNLLAKSDSNNNKKEKEIKSVKKKEKEKEKEIKKEKNDITLIKNKIKEEKQNEKEKQKIIEKNKDKNQQINKTENGGIAQINKNKKQKNKIYDDNKKDQTLLELMNKKDNLVEVSLNEDHYNNKNINNSKKDQKKYSIDIKSEDNKPKNETDDKNEYIKRLKSKIVIVNGKMVMEKPDVGAINKKYNEEHYKNISPIETIFVNNEEKVVNSLSFLNIKPTKKWTEEENELFYKSLELFGLDFSFLEIVLKKRTREEIKRKYLKEKQNNPKKIENAIDSRKDLGKIKQILELFKKEKGQNYLGLFKEESFRTRRNISGKDEKIDYDKEYKNILNKK